MVRLGFFLLTAVVPLLSQTAAKSAESVAPEVDQALRSRVAKFYQAHVEGKFRAADEFVAADSKDAFYEANKRRCRSFEITNVEYAEKLTKATVTVTCEMDVAMPGAGVVRVNAPITSLWKLEGGEWCWYTQPASFRETPFGPMRPGPEAKGTSGPLPAAPTEADRKRGEAAMATLLSMVKADKSEIRLKRSQCASGEVVITNNFPGTVSLVLQYSSLPGLEIKLDRTELAKGEAARASFRYKPQDNVPVPDRMMVQFMVQPTYHVIPVWLYFDR